MKIMTSLSHFYSITLLATALVALGCGADGGNGSAAAGGGTDIAPDTLCEAIDVSLAEQRIGPARNDPKSYNDQDREASCQLLLDGADGMERVVVKVYKPDGFEGATGSALLHEAPGAHEVKTYNRVGDEGLGSKQGSGGTLYFRVGEEVFSVSVPDGYEEMEEMAVQIAENLVAQVKP